MNDSKGLTVEYPFHIERKPRGRKKLNNGPAPQQPDRSRVPRISRLMALAIKYESLISDGHIENYADLARLGNITRGRATQIMNLLALAPDIQEDILHLPPNHEGFDAINEHSLREMIKIPLWNHQRAIWRAVSRAQSNIAASGVTESGGMQHGRS